jgi:hypothetical protein
MDTPPVNCTCTLILTTEGSIARESRYVKSVRGSVANSNNVTKLTVRGLFSEPLEWARVLIAVTAIAR